MVNLKNYNVVLKHFVLLLTFISLTACNGSKYQVSKIQAKKIELTEKTTNNSEIEQFIKPYRDHIDKDLNEVLAYNPELLDKSIGKWQTNIGCFLADITFEKCNTLFLKRYQKSIDVCLLNHGGIRTIIPKGNVTTRNAYEVMPFENSAVIVALKGTQLLELANYIITEKKPHPLSGLTFTITKDLQASKIYVQGKPLEIEKTYYVVTSDYLSNGGDNMIFFKKSLEKYDIDYKLRNIMIDYFKEVDTLKINNDNRIIKE